MNERPTLFKPVGSAGLAGEEDFQLGDILVRPSLREVEANGARESLEPRVMQVLVALARANGAVVSRDELIRQCWGGRIVGEDAINRCVSKIRQLAELGGSKAFEIETIPRVGYRLQKSPNPFANPKSADIESDRGRVWPFWAAAAALVLLTAAYLAKSLFNGPAVPVQWQVASYELVANSAMEERMPTLSPDAQFLVYWAAKNLTATTRLYLKNLSQDQTAPFSAPPLGWGDLAPAWSPQSDRVAFVRMREGSLPTPAIPCVIMVKSVPSGSEHEVGHCGSEAYTARVSWADDGRALYFADRPSSAASSRIRKLDLASGRTADITHPPLGAGDYDANMSPDGTQLAFVRHRAGDIKDVFVQNLPFQEPKQVTRDGASLYTAWAPDRQSLFVTSIRSGNSDLWSIPANGSGLPQRVLVGLTGLGRISVAGDAIALELWRRRSNIVGVKDGHEVPATTGQRADFAPEFSAEGNLAFFSASGGLALWTKTPGSDPARLLKLAVQSVTSPRWSPDGKTIAFIAHSKDRCTLYFVSAENAEVRHFDLPNEDTNAPAWNGDDVIIYPSRSGMRWKLRASGPGHSARPAPGSFDGWQEVRVAESVLYGVKAGVRGIWRVESKGPAAPLAPDFDGAAVPEGWTIGNHYLYTVDVRSGVHNASVLRQSLDGGRAEIVATGLDWADDSNASTGGLTLDPMDGALFYAKNGLGDTDIGILRLVRR